MSQPTLTEIYAAARAKLGDTEVTGGQIYTDVILLPHIQSAVRDMFRAMRNFAVGRIRRTCYFTLPANTNILYPATMLVTDFGAPISVDNRGALTTVAVTGAVASGSDLQVTTAANAFVTGDMIVLAQLGGLANANGIFGITVVNGTTFKANGVVPIGAYTSGGVAVKSTDEFVRVNPSERILQSSAQNRSVAEWTWGDNAMNFSMSTEDRQLRIRYYSSGSTPASGSDVITVDDSIDFLAAMAGGKAAKANGALAISADLKNEAVGGHFEQGVPGGLLRALLQALVRQLQVTSPESRSPYPYQQQQADYYLG